MSAPCSMMKLHSLPKSKEHLALLKASFMSHQTFCSGSMNICMDTWMTLGIRVRALAVFPDLAVYRTLPSRSSIFTSELVALPIAINRIIGLEVMTHTRYFWLTKYSFWTAKPDYQKSFRFYHTKVPLYITLKTHETDILVALYYVHI